MKKGFFATVFVFLTHVGWSQSGDQIFVNPTDNYQGTMYTVPDGSGTYTVLKNNTLYSISKMHGMSVSELMDMNGLINNTIRIGQVLKVASTTTLGSGLKLNNNVSSSYAQTETTSTVAVQASMPSNAAVWARAEVLKSEGQDIESLKGTEVLREDSVLWYVAGNEDSYHTIATHFDMSFDVLKADNEMGDYLLKPGMVLIVAPGRLYGMKVMPENMPELEPEEVLTTEEAEKIMEAQESEAVEVVEEALETIEEEAETVEEELEEELETIDEDLDDIEETLNDAEEEVEFSDDEEVEMDW